MPSDSELIEILTNTIDGAILLIDRGKIDVAKEILLGHTNPQQMIDRYCINKPKPKPPSPLRTA